MPRSSTPRPDASSRSVRPNTSSRNIRGSLRKVFFFLHLWLGLLVGLYYAVIGVTGGVLVFREDLESRQVMPERTYVAPPAPGAMPLALSAVVARVRTHFPEATEAQLAFFIPPPHKDGAYLWRVKADGAVRTTTIDPYTGAVIRSVDPRGTFLTIVDDLHTDLLLGEPGKLMNGYGGLLSGVVLVSGLWLWWPLTVRQIKIRLTVKKGAGTPRLIVDLHNVMGSYLFLLLLVVTVSGAVIVFFRPVQKQVVALFGSSQIPRPPVVKLPSTTPAPERLPVEELVRVAEGIAPDSQFVFVSYPTKPDQPLYAYKRSPTGILPDTRIYLDPYTGSVLQVGQDISDPRSKQIMRSNASLHFGRWGGWPIKVLYFIIGLLPLGLLITGVLMSVRRWRSQAASRKRRRRAAEQPGPEA